jgi:hypothetical protein
VVSSSCSQPAALSGLLKSELSSGLLLLLAPAAAAASHMGTPVRR